MFGSYQIRPTTVGDLPALGRFLITGFGVPPDAPHFAETALRWKYFEPCGIQFGPRSYVARSDGQIVGHIGIAAREFVIHDGADSSTVVPTLHFIDLLGSPGHPTVGLLLMKRGFQGTDVQFALGGTSDWRRMAKITGYECRSEFPVLFAILRPFYRRRGAGLLEGISRLPHLGWDLVRSVANRGVAPQRPLTLRRVDRFGNEVDTMVRNGPAPLARTTRSSELLNYYLRYPGGPMSGWAFDDGSRQVGFAVLNIMIERDVRQGKIVECFLETTDEDLWHAAITELRRELKRQGADVASCYASTGWQERASRRAGFIPLQQSQPFFLRDPQRRLPRDIPFHLTPLEADHAYV
jgi:hypothetical protein